MKVHTAWTYWAERMNHRLHPDLRGHQLGAARSNQQARAEVTHHHFGLTIIKLRNMYGYKLTAAPIAIERSSEQD
jgi:hypothetical protein